MYVQVCFTRYTNNSDKPNYAPLQMKLATFKFKFLLAMSITMAGMVHATPFNEPKCGDCTYLCDVGDGFLEFVNFCYRCCNY